jgi:hypothetical protein
MVGHARACSTVPFLLSLNRSIGYLTSSRLEMGGHACACSTFSLLLKFDRSIGYLSSFSLEMGGHALGLEPQTLSGLDALITAPGCVKQ